jgi:hypothetical protein
MGRDKHENEYLIKYGWPGDLWFHVEGLSSAHVYFRFINQSENDTIPIDDLPKDSVYDMMQIVKNNSIAGCKLASTKIVYTPHSNLKKTFDMDSGTVTYHDTKLCRYSRCDKDRQRVKDLERTKTERVNVDFYEEMKGNEKRIIERKKRDRKTKADTELYDPMMDDLKLGKLKATREGDLLSGIDTGLAALEGLSFNSTAYVPLAHPTGASDTVITQESESDEPVWVHEANSRLLEPSDDIRFLRARGYTSDEASGAIDPSKSRVVALCKLWNKGSPSSSVEVSTEVMEARQEEKEVLLAIFGEDDSVEFGDDETLFDAILSITSYEPPSRYVLPPPLLLEIYVDNGMSTYPNEPPVLALVGGGLPETLLNELTNRLRAEAMERATEEPGDPQIFNLLGFLGDEVEKVIEEETAELKKQMEEERKVRADARRKAEAERRKEDEPAPATSFKSEGERRAYAQEVLSKGVDSFANAKVDDGKDGKKERPGEKRYNTGVSDQSLIMDMFG